MSTSSSSSTIQPPTVVVPGSRPATPENVGILALDVYFPGTCVNQTALETFDNAGAGKYTVGLGQTNMAFCSDREDIHSICLTVVQSLMTKYNVPYTAIGRLEVGTETIVDKSKSVKSVLMRLFEESGNSEVEGVDTTNACYGGTNALFNAVNWVESRSWDGRFALVVAGDIAVYASGSARPTGGAGVVAMLVGPNAPIVFESGLRSTHMEHAYDFYKPRLESEYPEVDGKLSVQLYLKAVDVCYNRYAARAEAQGEKNFSLDSTDFVAFHSPFNKLVQKSLGRIMFNDFRRTPENPKFAGLEKFAATKPEDSYFDRELESAFLERSKKTYAEKTQPTVLLAKQLGNMYTGSLYGGLVSLLVERSPAELVGKRVIMFSYGSGLAASMFSLRFVSAPETIATGLSDVKPRLDSRIVVDPADFDRLMHLREETHNLTKYAPVGNVDHLFPGTWYLDFVDEKFRRTYKQKPAVALAVSGQV
ncbi:hydroxymethylglutaryl-CoA synthase 1, variant [Capsaspora owczarzaki ATCC 30864]|nr:hydroxymethylglutaryl-CoA synthase 1, variant [Capsaspora owczarzaki ATCC 30864]